MRCGLLCRDLLARLLLESELLVCIKFVRSFTVSAFLRVKNINETVGRLEFP